MSWYNEFVLRSVFLYYSIFRKENYNASLRYWENW